jgi:hypothetical protein
MVVAVASGIMSLDFLIALGARDGLLIFWHL